MPDAPSTVPIEILLVEDDPGDVLMTQEANTFLVSRGDVGVGAAVGR